MDITKALNALAKLPAKAFLEAYPTLKLSEIIPVSDTAAPLKPGHVKPTKTDDPVTDYEFVLPHGKTVKDYVDATLKDFKIAGSDEAKIKSDLTAAFAKTIADLKAEFPIVEAKDFEIEKNLLELETLLMQNFEDYTSLKKLAKPDSAKKAEEVSKGLFPLLFGEASLPFEPVVYVLKPASSTPSAQEQLVKGCVDNVNAAAIATSAPAALSTPEDGAKALLNSVLEHLQTKDDAKNVAIKWSEILTAMKAYGVNGGKIDNASGITTFTDTDFKFSHIAKPADAQVKFFVPFGKFNSVAGMNNDALLVQYFVNCNTPTVTGKTNFNEAFSALIKLVENDIASSTSSDKRPAFDSANPYNNHLFLQKLTIKNDELVKLINEALKPLAPTRTITVAEDDIKLDDKSFFTFDATNKKLKGEFSLRSDDKSTDEEIIKKYIDYLVASLDLKKSDAEIKQDFLTKFVAKENVAAFEKSITNIVQAEAATDKLKKDGNDNVGDGNQNNATPSSGNDGWPIWAWVLIGIGGAGFLGATVFVVYVKVVNKDKM